MSQVRVWAIVVFEWRHQYASMWPPCSTTNYLSLCFIVFRFPFPCLCFLFLIQSLENKDLHAKNPPLKDWKEA